jgi:hypothetical protein
MPVMRLVTPLVLGSMAATIPAGVSAWLVIARMVREHRRLLSCLDGHVDYARSERYCLLLDMVSVVQPQRIQGRVPSGARLLQRFGTSAADGRSVVSERPSDAAEAGR